MSKIFNVFIEALLVGLITMFVGSLSSNIISMIYKKELLLVNPSWNKYYVMEQSLFLTGVLVHILCQVVGINKYYCTYGSFN